RPGIRHWTQPAGRGAHDAARGPASGVAMDLCRLGHGPSPLHGDSCRYFPRGRPAHRRDRTHLLLNTYERRLSMLDVTTKLVNDIDLEALGEMVDAINQDPSRGLAGSKVTP